MKSQALSMDLFMAITILLVIVSGMALVIHEFMANEEQSAMNRDMQLKGEAAINSMVNSPGDFEGGTNSSG